MQQRSKLSTTVLPLPLPGSSATGWGSFAGLSRRRLEKLCRARLLHVLVLTVNFMHLGRYPTLEELATAVCGSLREQFPWTPGRTGPELGASLLQLESFMDSCSEFRLIDPYCTLDASRLRLVGEGAWRMEEFLRGPLWLPFQEPAFLQHGLEVDLAFAPDCA